MGLAVEAISLVAALERIIEMFCTCTKLVGDFTVVIMLDHSEKRADDDIDSHAQDAPAMA